MVATVIQLVILALTGTMITAAAVDRYTQANEWTLDSQLV